MAASVDALPELTIVRTFKALPDRVFRAWTEPERLVQWLGPEGFQAHSIELDVQAGGKWRACIRRTEDGDDNWMSGHYRELDPPHRLVFTFAWEHTGFETIITLIFEDVDGGTRMTFHQKPFRDVESRDSHQWGWTSAFDRLDDNLATSDRERGIE